MCRRPGDCLPKSALSSHGPTKQGNGEFPQTMPLGCQLPTGSDDEVLHLMTQLFADLPNHLRHAHFIAGLGRQFPDEGIYSVAQQPGIGLRTTKGTVSHAVFGFCHLAAAQQRVRKPDFGIRKRCFHALRSNAGIGFATKMLVSRGSWSSRFPPARAAAVQRKGFSSA